MNFDHEDLIRMNRVLRHRLRNFASGMKTSVSFLAKELEGRLSPSEMEYFPLIAGECDGVTEITNRMSLLFDDFQTGDEAMLGVALEKAVTQLRARYPAAKLRVELGTAAALRIASMHGGVVILGELIANAVEATPNGEVVVACGVESGQATIEVRDVGPGVKPEESGKLFLPFYTTKARHLGIGLTMAEKIAGQLSGSIEAGNADGGGFRARLTLPAG